MQLAGGVPAHEVLGTQPYPFAPHRAPEGGKHLTVEPPTCLREHIQLYGFADLYAAYQIVPHMCVFFLSARNAVMCLPLMQ